MRTASPADTTRLRRFAPHQSMESPRGKKRKQLRFADPTRLRRFPPHFVPTWEFRNSSQVEPRRALLRTHTAMEGQKVGFAN